MQKVLPRASVQIPHSDRASQCVIQRMGFIVVWGREGMVDDDDNR